MIQGIQSVRKDIASILDQLDRQGKRDNLSLYLNKLCQQIDNPAQKEHAAKDNTLDKFLQGYTADTLTLYRHSLGEWRRMHEGQADTLCFEMATSSPLIVGKGDENVHEFGISLQAPWGTPFIPGSAVKGVLSSFSASQGGEEWQRNFNTREDGQFGLAMFGGIGPFQQEMAGGMCFMNAWWIPGSGGRSPFIEDIINVHCRSYYQQGDWPHGMDSPVPNKFLVVRPGERFLFAIRGPEDWRQLAREMLIASADGQGFGAKTRVGYGRLSYSKSETDFKSEIPTLDDEQLAQLFIAQPGRTSLRESFAAECWRRPYAPALDKLFIKFRPAAALLAHLRAKAPRLLSEAATIRKQFNSQLPAAELDRTDPDIQAIFTFCLPLAPNGVVTGTWLARFAPTAADLLAQKSAEEIETLLLDYADPWPPLSEFSLAIESHPLLNQDEKRSCLELLALRLEEP